MTREREDFNEKYQALESANNEIRSNDNAESIQQSHMNAVNELNQELLAIKAAYDELDKEKQSLISELERRPAGVDQEQAIRTAGMHSSFSTGVKCISFCVLEKVSPNQWKDLFREVCLVFFLFYSPAN